MEDYTYKRRTFLGLTAGAAATGLASVAAADTPSDLRAISYSETRQGELDTDDPADPEYSDLAEPVQFEGSSGDRIRVTQESTSFDAYLLLVGPDGNYVASNDDGFDTNTNAQLTTTLQQSGTYTIWAGSLSGDAVGAYTLSLEKIDTQSTDGADLRSISFGETVEGELDFGDPNEPEYDGIAEPVEFDGTAGDVVRITQRSAEFDTYLLLIGTNGGFVASNDDGVGSGTNSQIVATLEQSGTYTVWAGSLSGNATGEYTLTLERAESTEDARNRSVDPQSIAYGDTVESELDLDDPSDPEYGDRAEPFAFEGTRGDGVTITQRSSDFDAYLLLVGPDGNYVTSNDDGFDTNTDAQLTTTLRQSGTYTVWAGSLAGNATGAYTLELAGTEGSADDGADLRSISYGETVDGELDLGDPTDPVYGEPAEPVEFTGSSGDVIRITQQSDDFDTYLVLVGPDGNTVTEQDDGTDTTNSQVTVTLQQSGAYTIWASSYDGSLAGTYTLSLEGISTQETATRTASQTDANDGGDSGGSDGGESGSSVPGFGVLGTVGALGAGALLRRLRTGEN